MGQTNHWLLFALGSACFAALTTLFGKIGVSGINSNLATFTGCCFLEEQNPVLW